MIYLSIDDVRYRILYGMCDVRYVYAIIYAILRFFYALLCDIQRDMAQWGSALIRNVRYKIILS